MSAFDYPECVTNSIMDIEFEAKPSDDTWPAEKFPAFPNPKSPL